MNGTYFTTKLENTIKTIIKAGVDFKDIKVAARNQVNGYVTRVFGERPMWGNVIASCKGNGSMECTRDWYDVEVKGKTTTYNGYFYLVNGNNEMLDDVNHLNAEEFIVAFYELMKTHDEGNVWLNFSEKLKNVVTGFRFSKKDMTLYINYYKLVNAEY